MSDHTSASATDTFLACPWFFLHRRTFAAGQPKGGALIVGTAMHHAAEMAILDKLAGTVWTDEQVAAAYIAKIEEQEALPAPIVWGSNGDQRHKMIEEGHRASISLWRYLKNMDIEIAEAEFDIEVIPGFSMQGRIDAVAGQLVLDFKSASPRASWTENKAFGERQPGMYALARKVQTGEYPEEFRFIVATKQGNPSLAQYIVSTGPVRALAALSVARVIGKAVQAGVTPKNTGDRGHCSICPSKGKC